MKNEKIKTSNLKNPKQAKKISFCKKKIIIFQEMISNTVLAIQNYKIKDIIGVSELNTGIQGLESLYNELNKLQNSLKKKNVDIDNIINKLKKMNCLIFLEIQALKTLMI
jgi:hypothetical protein